MGLVLQCNADRWWCWWWKWRTSSGYVALPLGRKFLAQSTIRWSSGRCSANTLVTIVLNSKQYRLGLAHRLAVHKQTWKKWEVLCCVILLIVTYCFSKVTVHEHSLLTWWNVDFDISAWCNRTRKVRCIGAHLTWIMKESYIRNEQIKSNYAKNTYSD